MGGQWLPQDSGLTGRGLVTKELATRQRHARNRDRRQKGASARRQHGDGRRSAGGCLHSAFLLPQETFDCRQLPNVSRAGGKGAEAVAGLRNAGDQWHEGLYPLRSCDQGAEGSDGIPADQPPAGLPNLRSGRRVPVAGHVSRLRSDEKPLHRGKARGLPQECRPAHCRHGTSVRCGYCDARENDRRTAPC